MNEQDLSNYRKIYHLNTLRKKELHEDPINQFKKWFHEAEASKVFMEPNAMTLSTYGKDDFPKSRVVLLKKFTWEGFVFYTNYLSEKGLAITENPKVCLSFFWANLERQVIIKGKAEKISPNLSDGYFEQRPRGSQLSAWASYQSKVIKNRNVLEEELKKWEKKFEGKEIPRPDHWGGYIVKPLSIEFWQGRADRMHDRIRYTLKEDFNWKIERLSP